ncbi:MAG TPA: hypothetical protein VFI06_09290 [Chitinophagaceae bacterium]|nr:hypothetical protein [Chitinophagaceae bacterium]
MKAYAILFFFISSIICACNNASQIEETKDSTNVQSVPDNTRNNDTGTIGDTFSYDRMHQQTDSLRDH